jgi:predicted nucleic acid-binding Zn ribbon protein
VSTDDTPGSERPVDDHNAGDQVGAGTSGSTEPAGVELTEADAADNAAASALARARQAARAKGLRPGSGPTRKTTTGRGRRWGDLEGSGHPDSDGRDPSLIGDQLDRLMLDRGWNVDVAVGAVMGRWAAIVGAEVAAHCTPVTFSDSVLTVRADSTAWATQLRLMSSSILGRLESEVGKEAVTELRVQGPSAPSWTRGLRKSTGRGPRDTYG